ncbi:hypothetical protein ACOSQ4_010069 [Xanthoceras sorbifolium]
MKDLTMGLQTLDAKVEQHIRRIQLPPPPIPSPPPVGQHSQAPLSLNFSEAAPQMKSMRLDVPRFSGANPTAWVSRIQRYFDYYNTPDPQRLIIASFHLDGDALDWFDWMSKNHLIFRWHEFLLVIEKHFGPSEYEDHFGKLSKLVQTNALSDYQHQFEHLANKIPWVPEHALVSYFVSGLRHDLRKEIQVYKPQSLIQAMGLARLYDDKVTDSKTTTKSWVDRNWSTKPTTFTKPSTLPPLLPTSPSSQLLPASNSKQPYTIKKLSTIEMLGRREKGLCYNCDEKFFVGHKCKGRLFLFLVDDDSSHEFDDPVDVQPSQEMVDPVTEIPEISLHAIAGQPCPRTLRLHGQISGLRVQTLVDGGSTHNFIQERVAKFLKLPISASPHFNVLIGNGQSMVCDGYCPQVLITLGDESFHIDFYVLQLQGADVVLGVQWLELLGRITLDYKKLYMEFQWDGRMVRLQGEPLMQIEQVQFNQLRRMSKTEGISYCFQLFSMTASQASPPQVLSDSVQLMPLLDLYKEFLWNQIFPFLFRFKQMPRARVLGLCYYKTVTRLLTLAKN